ncbi:hypothetical protein niasHT_032572 [Heterodera trifolii]|uniref:Uncharacterized protein n=1 Tax=Heterodera trifolii TaxID=157864 RepID=A0ABD2IMJ7_9BILA
MTSLANSMDWMKHLLTTGEHPDVHFLVGDGDEKEILPAHKHILMNTSDVFEAMFRFDSQNGESENASTNCPVVEVPDIEPTTFKLMLKYIYVADLSELNGENAMAVLYAAKKYNIPALVDRSLQIPISELGNVFMTYAYACLFELKDFANKCLRYICQNAALLFKSDDFLEIDQKIFCVLLDLDRLLLSNEFEIWKIALRWADEKCRQNGIECSSDNRRSVLGPALFKIRFPNMLEEDFSKFVVRSGLLTVEEVFGVYQFNSHPNLSLRGVPELYSLKFPSHGRISDWNTAKRNGRGTLALEIEKVSEFAGKSVGGYRFSDTVYINGLGWKIKAEIREGTAADDEKKYLGFFLWYERTKYEKPLNCLFSATFRIVSEKSETENSTGTLCDYNNQMNSSWGFGNFISFEEMVNPINGYYNREEDKVTLTIDVMTVDEPKMDKFILGQNKSTGTLFMEIEKASEFGREVFGSDRKSETVHINGLPWKILAKIQTKNGSVDNEKWLGIYLSCGAPEKDLHWRCCVRSAIFRIINRKNGAENSTVGTLCDRVFDNNSTNRGFPNFISFVELMDPEKGFYTKCEDKVTLTIDVITVDEPKMDKFIWDQSKSKGTLLMDIEKVSGFAMEILESERQSETVQIKGLPWKIWAEINQRKESSDNNEKWLGIYLWCDMPREDKNWSCKCSAILRIVSQIADYRREFSDQFFDNKSNSWGYDNFISFSELMDQSKALINQNEDKLTLAIDFTVNEANMKLKPLEFQWHGRVSDWIIANANWGTLTMKIEKFSEFTKEKVGSRRNSEAVQMKGFEWKISAEITTDEKDGTDKYLGFYLLCCPPPKNDGICWSCECSATLRIVSQKSGTADFTHKFDRILNNKANSWGFPKFTSMEFIMDPDKGLYDSNEDKVTLAIDLTVEEK